MSHRPMRQYAAFRGAELYPDDGKSTKQDCRLDSLG
jgi:hypothetical protein